MSTKSPDAKSTDVKLTDPTTSIVPPVFKPANFVFPNVFEPVDKKRSYESDELKSDTDHIDKKQNVEIWKCPICNIVNQFPMVAGCGHSLCFNCVIKLGENTKCPICHETCSWSPNYVMVETIVNAGVMLTPYNVLKKEIVDEAVKVNIVEINQQLTSKILSSKQYNGKDLHIISWPFETVVEIKYQFLYNEIFNGIYEYMNDSQFDMLFAGVFHYKKHIEINKKVFNRRISYNTTVLLWRTKNGKYGIRIKLTDIKK